MGLSNPTKLLFDEMRQKWVKATPEELVRQQWLKRMTLQLGYPKELLVIEKEIKELPCISSIKVPDRRIDILCYGKGESLAQPLFPLLLIECKSKDAPLMAELAQDQLIGYNDSIGAPFVAVITGDQVRFRCVDTVKERTFSCSFLPSFKELMQWFKQ